MYVYKGYINSAIIEFKFIYLRIQFASATFPHGSVSIDDDTNMTHFVADNLEYKIKIASPVSKKDMSEFGVSQTSIETGQLPTKSAAAVVLQHQFLTSMPQIDANVLNDIEIEAQYLAANIDNITENLCNLLHSVRKYLIRIMSCWNAWKSRSSTISLYFCFLVSTDIIDCGR